MIFAKTFLGAMKAGLNLSLFRKRVFACHLYISPSAFTRHLRLRPSARLPRRFYTPYSDRTFTAEIAYGKDPQMRASEDSSLETPPRSRAKSACCSSVEQICCDAGGRQMGNAHAQGARARRMDDIGGRTLDGTATSRHPAMLLQRERRARHRGCPEQHLGQKMLRRC